MLKTLTILLLGLVLALPVFAGGAAGALPPIPDAVGRAGMAAAVVDGEGGLLAAGGANFPGADPWLADKTFHDDVWKLDGGAWHEAGHLQKPLAYAAFATWKNQLVMAGGADAKEHLTAACLLSPGKDGALQRKALPDLPEPLAYAAGCMSGDTFYVFGGQTGPQVRGASDKVYALKLGEPNAAWKVVGRIPGGGRMLAGAGAKLGTIYLFGGCALSDKNDSVFRTYLSSGFAFDPNEKDAAKAWTPVADLPSPLVAMASPAATVGEYLVVVGGDDGGHYGKEPKTHPGQTRAVLAFDRLRNRWENWGDAPDGLATAPLVKRGTELVTVSGELRPRIRTAQVSATPVQEPVRFGGLDALTGALGLAGLGLLVFVARRDGLQGVKAAVGGAGKPGFYGWLVVALLWVVVMLNYLDRQVLTSMRDPIVESLPQNDFQFGLLTGLFLFIYAACSPLGGWLADRFSRRLVMLGALILWSLVTWLTGHAKDYHQLLLFRALMGVSEACYIPAALAYITDIHSGRTRSLATGLHQSGIYAGKAFAGVGGTMAVLVGWRMGFSILGFAGVAYALVLLLVLRDRKAEGAAAAIDPSPAATEPLRWSIFIRPSFLMLLLVVGMAGMANWFIMGWMPTLLKEKFNLSLASAGWMATVPTTVANYAAVLLGGLCADLWATRQPKARAWLAGIAFCLCGPVLFACLFAGSIAGALGLSALVVFIACVVAQAVAQGVMDATLMPILRGQINPRFAATGYGMLNLVSAGLGGALVIFGGAFKDQGHDPVAVLAAGGAGLLVCGILFFCLPAPRPE